MKKLDLAPEVAPGAFAPVPGFGTAVTVVVDGELRERYLVRPDGSKRPPLPTERAKRYDEPAKTNADGTPYVPKK